MKFLVHILINSCDFKVTSFQMETYFIQTPLFLPIPGLQISSYTVKWMGGLHKMHRYSIIKRRQPLSHAYNLKKTKMVGTSKQDEINCTGERCHSCNTNANTQKYSSTLQTLKAPKHLDISDICNFTRFRCIRLKASLFFSPPF